MQLANMKNAIRNIGLALWVLAGVSLLTRGFSGAATPAPDTSTAPARHYYLTKDAFNGDKSLKACASGYHFASFAEILDTGVLTYNSTLGRTNADDGAGPPSIQFGWARTGYSASSTNTEYPTNNCNLWTSGATADYGTTGAFVPPYANGTINGNGTGTVYTPSTVFSQLACDNSQGYNVGVWCMQN
jgi:hypothetical protein